jgi:hypothetical protein
MHVIFLEWSCAFWKSWEEKERCIQVPSLHSANWTLLPLQGCLSWVAPRYGISLSRCITIIRSCKLHCWSRWPPCKYLPMCLAPSMYTRWNRLTSPIKGREVLYSGSVYWRHRARTQPLSSSWIVKAVGKVEQRACPCLVDLRCW